MFSDYGKELLKSGIIEAIDTSFRAEGIVIPNVLTNAEAIMINDDK